MKISRELTEVVTIEITSGDILRYLTGEDRNGKIHIPNGATDLQVFVRIPGGGDWSNMDLEINSNTPLTIRYRLPRVITST